MGIKNDFIKMSTVAPEELKKILLITVGEKAQDEVYNYLMDLEQSYPGFKSWYNETVLREMYQENSGREIILSISYFDETPLGLTGIAILKKTAEEKKICTFRINEKYRKLGIGTELFTECLKFLETDKPMLTVAEDRLEMFQPLIKKYNFEETQRLEDYYVKGSVEHVFNGILKI